MAIQQIQKSSVPKPDMVGDLVEVTIYDKSDGALSTVAGTLTGYALRDGYAYLSLQDVAEEVEVNLEDFTISIAHYEYILDLSTTEADE